MSDELQSLCAKGQELLLATDYIRAERTLDQAESIALRARDWDSLHRLYMPLQEVRRQIRQRCGEGIIRLDLIARNATESFDPAAIAKQYPHGQILVAGFGTIEPARKLRQIVRQESLYLDVFIAASYWVNGSVVVAILPTDHTAVPEEGEYSPDELVHRLPPHTVLIPASELPKGDRPGTTQTFAWTMGLWERLHLPYLAMADQCTDLERRLHGYRDTIAVDYACELAHQKLSDAARELIRARK